MPRLTWFCVCLVAILQYGVFCYALKEVKRIDIQQSRRQYDTINLSARGSIPEKYLKPHNPWNNTDNQESDHNSTVNENGVPKGTQPLRVTSESSVVQVNVLYKPQSQYKHEEENEVDNYAVESNNSHSSSNKYESQKSNTTETQSSMENNSHQESQQKNKSVILQGKSKGFQLQKEENDGYSLSRQLFAPHLQNNYGDIRQNSQDTSKRQATESQNDFLTEEGEDSYGIDRNQQLNSAEKTSTQENTSGESDAKQDSTGYTKNYVGYEQQRDTAQSRTGYSPQEATSAYTHYAGTSQYVPQQDVSGHTPQQDISRNNPQNSYAYNPQQFSSGYTQNQGNFGYSSQQGLSGYNFQQDTYQNREQDSYRLQQDSYTPQQEVYRTQQELYRPQQEHSAYKPFNAVNYGAEQTFQGAINSQPSQYTPFKQGESLSKPGTSQEFIGRRPEQVGYKPHTQISEQRHFQNNYRPTQNTFGYPYQQHSELQRPFQAGSIRNPENRFPLNRPQPIYYGYTTQHIKDTYSHQFQPENLYGTQGNQQFEVSKPYNLNVNRADNTGLCQYDTIKHSQNPNLFLQNPEGYKPVPDYGITKHTGTQNYLPFSSPQKNPNIIAQEYQQNYEQYQNNKNTDYKGNQQILTPSIAYNTGVPVNSYIPPVSSNQASGNQASSSYLNKGNVNYYNQHKQQQNYVPNVNNPIPGQNYIDRTVSPVSQNRYGTAYSGQSLPQNIGQLNSTFDEQYGTVPNYQTQVRKQSEIYSQTAQNENYNTSPIYGQTHTIQTVDNRQINPHEPTPYPSEDDGSINFQTPVPADLLTPPKDASSSSYNIQSAPDPYGTYNTAKYSPSISTQYNPSVPSAALQYNPTVPVQFSSVSNYTDNAQSLYQTTRASPSSYVNSFRF